MKLGKLFKFGKKGAKMAQKSGGKKTESAFAWPPGLKVGVYGHANAGKTTYFTVLNEDCKIASNLQISVTDNATAGEFLTNYRKIWGLGTGSNDGVGTVVDLHEERCFPDKTVKDILLSFTAIVDRSKKLPVVTYDYPGDAVSITKQNEFADKVADFMIQCDGLLFFFDPKTLRSELECQAHVASFVNMLEKLAPLNRRLPIPVALVVTKADTLPGFKGEEQTILISAEDEPIVCEDYELFLQKVLSSEKVSRDPEWTGTVRDLLVKLKDFLKVAVGRTLDFQIFFTSSTGEQPEKVGAEVGRSIYKPPEKISPVGVREPFYWLLNAIVRNRSLDKMRAITKYVAVACLAWILLFSGVYLWHFSFQLGRATAIEDEYLSRYNNDPFQISVEEQDAIRKAYGKYETRWLVSRLFPLFKAPARELKDLYGNLSTGSQAQQLDNVLVRFTAIAATPALWPTVVPGDDTLALNADHKKLVTDLKKYHRSDSTSAIFRRSDRALRYWDLFTEAIKKGKDTTAWSTLIAAVEYDRKLFADELNNKEKALGEALIKAAEDKKAHETKTVVSHKAVVELEGIFEEINNNPDPTYRLKTAVKKLRAIKAKLDPAKQADDIKIINKYLREAKAFNKKRTYTYRIVSMPSDGHLHIDVTPPGQDPTWSVQDQLLPGADYQLVWKPGYVIHVAYDDIRHECNWGRNPSDSRVFDGEYSIFDIEGEITFNNIGKTVTISFKPGLRNRLPELKK